MIYDNSIQQFYNQNPFPGLYSIEQLNNYEDKIQNKYLNVIDNVIRNRSSNLQILDIGCGTGLISNLFSLRYPSNNFVGIDFSDGINFARRFAETNNIKNINFVRENFINFENTDQFDIVICQGVLHHMPNSIAAIANIKKLIKPEGILILGLYHPYGKIAKKIFSINYKSLVLYKDQELNPFEISYSVREVKELFKEFSIVNYTPSILGNVAIRAFFNYRNGGLVTYIMERKK